MKSRTVIILLLICFALTPLQSVNAKTINVDSLVNLLTSRMHDSTKCNLLEQILENQYDDQIWPIYNQKLFELSQKNINPTTNGTLKRFYQKKLSNAINNIGFIHDNKGEIVEALYFYNQSLKIQLEIKNNVGIAMSYNNIGFIYNNLGDIPKAIDYLHKSLTLREGINDKAGIAMSLNNLGIIYYNQGDLQRALDFYMKSVKINVEIDDKMSTANSYNNIGIIYDGMDKYQEALDCYFKALKLSKEINDERRIAYSNNNIGAVYKKMGELNLALSYYEKSLQAREQLMDKQGIATSLNEMARILYEKRDLSKSLILAKKSFNLAKELGFPESIRRVSSTLKSIFTKQKNYKEALEMFELEIQMRDSINNEDTKKASIKKQFQYQYEKKAAADSLKNMEAQKLKNAQLHAQQAQLKQERTQRFALYGGLILVIVFSGFVWNRFKLTQKQKLIIEKQKLEVDIAYTQLHHKNKEITDSIIYASRIQRALITSEKYFEKYLKTNDLNIN